MTLCIMCFCEKLYHMWQWLFAVIFGFSVMRHRHNSISAHIFQVDVLDTVALYHGLLSHQVWIGLLHLGIPQGTLYSDWLSNRDDTVVKLHPVMVSIGVGILQQMQISIPWCVVTCWQMQCGHFEYLMLQGMPPTYRDWMLWLSAYHSCFIFWKFQVKILTQRPAILTEVFYGLPQSLLVNVRIVPSN
jgi:hypothetical protein